MLRNSGVSLQTQWLPATQGTSGLRNKKSIYAGDMSQKSSKVFSVLSKTFTRNETSGPPSV
ncbi:YopX-like protein [Salmonella phage 19]|nr:YopX-like protein [Salmonella phage 19]